MKLNKQNIDFQNFSKKSLFLLLITWVLFTSEASTQQEWLYSQAQFNLFDLNGAYAGGYEEMNFALRIRHQWVGFEGAPKSQYLSMHTPVVQNLGIGIRLLNENIGARSRQKLTTSLSVKFPVKNGFLGFGINTGLLRQQFIPDRIVLRDPQDVSLNKYTGPDMLIHFDFSALWYSKKYYFGLEIQNLNEPSFKSQTIIDLQQEKHLVIVGAYVFEFNKNLAVKPTTRMYYDKNTEILLDANLNFLLYEKIWLGAGVRLGLGINFFAEWNLSKNLRMGYSYDFYSREGLMGSHEVFLGYNLPKRGKANSIRYFK